MFFREIVEPQNVACQVSVRFAGLLEPRGHFLVASCWLACKARCDKEPGDSWGAVPIRASNPRHVGLWLSAGGLPAALPSGRLAARKPREDGRAEANTKL